MIPVNRLVCVSKSLTSELISTYRLFQTYPALTYGVFSVVAVMAFVVWPLTRDCRARRRRREMRRRQMLENEEILQVEYRRSESGALLAIADSIGPGYGTTCIEA